MVTALKFNVGESGWGLEEAETTALDTSSELFFTQHPAPCYR